MVFTGHVDHSSPSDPYWAASFNGQHGKSDDESGDLVVHPTDRKWLITLVIFMG